MTGSEYANLIAAYLTRNFGPRGLDVYREVALGKSIIGKNRRLDIFAVHRESGRAVGIECKMQNAPGTVDEKIPYAIDDMTAMHIPGFVIYAGEGFSEGVLHMLKASEIAAHCLPDASLEPGTTTIELDHLIAMTFGWWEAILDKKQPFDLETWKPPEAG